MKKKIIIIIGVVLVIALGVLGYLYLNKEKNTNVDGKKFAAEYTSVTEDNVFVYKTIDEIIFSSPEIRTIFFSVSMMA